MSKIGRPYWDSGTRRFMIVRLITESGATAREATHEEIKTMIDEGCGGPGPIERHPDSQQHFKQHGRWPEAVVDERMAAHDADIAAIRQCFSERA